MERTCIKCGNSYPLTSDFFHYRNKVRGEFHWTCKSCRSANENRLYHRMKEERPEAYERRKKMNEEYRAEHADEIKAGKKKYSQDNRNAVRVRKREQMRQRRANEPDFAWLDKARRRIRSVVVGKKQYSSESIKELTGLGKEELRAYLLQTFRDIYGYDWGGIEPTHIDHIIPLCTESTVDGKRKLFDYRNLRLVKASDNIAKCRSLDYQIGGDTSC